MCELLGISFNMSVNPNISFRAFRYRGRKNSDGWGVAFYPDKSVQIIKEPLKATESQLSDFIKNYREIKSRIIIAHVRLTSVGGVCYKNTHPFSRELNGNEFVFAHNGTLSNYKRLRLGRFKPIGTTDSEYIFCYLLSNIERREINQWCEDDFNWLSIELKKINSYGTFNCIFSNGDFLFCYHDIESYNGLCFVKRESPYSQIQLKDEDWEINLFEEKDHRQYGYIIATNELTSEKWATFKPGELIIFKDGKMIYSNKRNISKVSISTFTDLEWEILIILRKSRHGVPLRVIIERSNQSTEDIKVAIKSLIKNKYISQDSRYNVEWDHEDATYYTNPNKRKEIDKLINN
ncbi:MAG: class II glutamine amidotransferase [Candidatus Helarchaeota archaeon]